MGRKLQFLFWAFFIFYLVVGTNKVAEARTHRPRDRGPQFASLVVQNGEESDAPRSLTVTIERLTRRGHQLRRPRSFVMKADLAGGGEFKFERLRWNRFYGLRVVDSATGELLISEALPVFRTYPVKQFKLPGTPDPRLAQITSLQSQLAELWAELDAAGENRDELQAQIMALLAQIASLQEQLASGTPSSSVAVTTNSALMNPTYGIGATNVKLASFLVTIPVGKNLELNQLQFHVDRHLGLNLQNLTVKVGGAQFGGTLAEVSAALSGFGVSAPTPHNSGPGSFAIDVYGDLLATSAAGTYPSVIDLSGWGATDGSGTTVSFPGTALGQNLTLVDASVLTMRDWSSLLTQWVTPGTTGNRLSSYRITADNTGDIDVSQAIWHETSGLNTAPFSSYYLYDGATMVVGPVSATGGNTITFALSNYRVGRNSTRELVLVGTASTIASGAWRSGQWNFVMAPSDITARAVTTNASATVTGTLRQVYFVYTARTTLSIGYGTNGATSSRARTVIDRPFVLAFTPGSSGNGQLTYLKLAVSGGATPSSISAFTGDLIDVSTGTNLANSSQATASWDSAKNAWILSFVFSHTVPAGATKQVFVQFNSSGFADSSGADSLQLEVIDQTWNDGEASFGVLSSSPTTLQTSYQ